MAAYKLDREQANFFARCVAEDAAGAMEGHHEQPAAVLSAFDELVPLAALLRGLLEQSEIVDAELAVKLAIRHLGEAREHVGYETEALVRIREGNREWFGQGQDQRQSEQATSEQIERGVSEARLLREILRAANGRHPEAVSV